jgi:hypothetical protein
MTREDFGGRAATAQPPGEDGANNSGEAVDSHEQPDPITDLIARLRRAAETGEALSLGQRAKVTVRGLGSNVWRVEREVGQ